LYGVTPFHREHDSDTEAFILNAEVCFPDNEIKSISNNCRNFITFLLEKDEKVRNRYTFEGVMKQPWIAEDNISAVDNDMNLYEIEYEFMYNNYCKKKWDSGETSYRDSYPL
jgi:hypothetical protein